MLFFRYLKHIFTKKKTVTPHSPLITTSPKSSLIITSKDIKAIAGNDIMATQLDLARAYLEMGKRKLAKQILIHVTQHGNNEQQQEARELVDKI